MDFDMSVSGCCCINFTSTPPLGQSHVCGRPFAGIAYKQVKCERMGDLKDCMVGWLVGWLTAYMSYVKRMRLGHCACNGSLSVVK